MDLITIIVCVLLGALISNLRPVKSMSENAIVSARLASMNFERCQADSANGGDTEYNYGKNYGKNEHSEKS
jgi:hypothetical protein